jgi:hypothetical protein
MSSWAFVASIPPMLIWGALFLYLGKIERRMKALEQKSKDH